MTLNELIEKWENISWETTLYIEFYRANKFNTAVYIGNLKILVADIRNPKNPYHDLLNKEVFRFRKGCNGTRIYCYD